MTNPILLGGQVYLVVGSTIKRCVEFDHGEKAWQTVHDAKEREAVRSVLKDRAEEAARLVRITAVDEWFCKGGSKMGCHVYCTCDGTDPATIDPRL